jgi:hypothetical protein
VSPTLDMSGVRKERLARIKGFRFSHCPVCGEVIVSTGIDKEGTKRMLDLNDQVHADSCTGSRNKNRRYGT